MQEQQYAGEYHNSSEFRAVLAYSSGVEFVQGATCSNNPALGSGSIAGIGVGAGVFGAASAVLLLCIITRCLRRRGKKFTPTWTPAADQTMSMESNHHHPVTSELPSTTAHAGLRAPHPGSLVPLTHYYAAPVVDEKPYLSQELPVSDTRPSFGVWQGPGIAMVLPPPTQYHPNSNHDLTAAQESNVGGPSNISTTAGVEAPLASEDEQGVAYGQISPASLPTTPPPASQEPRSELMTKESMSTILSAQALSNDTLTRSDETASRDLSHPKRAPTPSTILS